MSEIFDNVDTETLRTLHRQIGDKAIAIFEEAAIAGTEGLETYPELMAYGRQLSGTAALISTELGIRHQITIADLDQRIADLNKLDGCTCGGIGATGAHFSGCAWSAR